MCSRVREWSHLVLNYLHLTLQPHPAQLAYNFIWATIRAPVFYWNIGNWRGLCSVRNWQTTIGLLRYPGLILGGPLNPKVLCFDATQALGESLPDLGALFSPFKICESCELIYPTCSGSGTQLTLPFPPHQEFTNVASLSFSSVIIPFLSAFPSPPLLLCLILISSSQSTLALQEGGRAPDSDSFSLSAS